MDQMELLGVFAVGLLSLSMSFHWILAGGRDEIASVRIVKVLAIHFVSEEKFRRIRLMRRHKFRKLVISV